MKRSVCLKYLINKIHRDTAMDDTRRHLILIVIVSNHANAVSKTYQYFCLHITWLHPYLIVYPLNMLKADTNVGANHSTLRLQTRRGQSATRHCH